MCMYVRALLSLLFQLTSDSSKGGAGHKDKLEPRTIDAYWLQREIKKFMNDPFVCEIVVNV